MDLQAANKISPHSIEVTWKPVPDEFMHGTLQDYEVTYKPIMVGEIKKEEERLKKIRVTENHTKLTNLEPYVTYSISVGARTVKGLGPSAFVEGGSVS